MSVNHLLSDISKWNVCIYYENSIQEQASKQFDFVFLFFKFNNNKFYKLTHFYSTHTYKHKHIIILEYFQYKF